jgi:putative ABC transport system ATP-binding protein
VLAGEPALVLADEPTGQLDRRTAAHVLDVLLEAVGTLGAALVVSTHDPDVAGRLGDRWSMTDGRLLEAMAGRGVR